MKLQSYNEFLNEGETQIESLKEGTYNSDREIAIYDGEDGLTYIEKRGKGYYGYNDEFDFEAENKAELEKKLKSWKYKLISGSIDEAFVEINEAYDGNLKDFRYEFPLHFENETGNNPDAIKKIVKAGKGYEVRTFTYMSEPEMKKVGDAMNLKLVSYEKSSTVAITVYESKKDVTEGEVLLFDEIGPEMEAFRSKIEKLIDKSTDDKWINALKKTMSSLDKLENDLAKADNKLGVVLIESDEFLDEADDKKLSLAQETIQKKRDLEEKKSELVKKLKEATEKEDVKASKLLRLQIKKIELQISMLLVDEQIKEMSKK